MKPLLFVSSILLLLFSCGDKIIEKIEETYPSNKPKTTSFYKVVDEKEIKVQEKEFYENGKVKMEGEFKDGKRTGKGLNYYPNGKLRMEGDYKNDKQTGHWKFYNEEGILIEEVEK